MALLLPLAGLGKSVALILSFGLYDKKDFHDAEMVQKAAVRGAFVVAQRTQDWKPTAQVQKVWIKMQK